VFPNSRSLDAVGVLAPDVRTAARVVDLMRGTPVAHRAIARPSLAVPWSWLAGLTPEVREAFLEVAHGLPDLALPPRAAFGPPAFAVVQYESYALHRRWLHDAPERYSDELRALLRSSARVGRGEYTAGLRECGRLRRAVRRAVSSVDAVLVPTVPCVAPPRARWPLRQRRTLSEWTRPFNVSDSAVVALPIPRAGLPVGLQVVANDEAAAIAVAAWVERRLRRGAILS
jgi:Asp-tRNA(Asn)/Glu-tRNA(Gln) amidotransferase A subunit family amidase